MTPTKEQLIEALELLRNELGLFNLKSDVLRHEFNQEVDATIKKAKRTKRKPSIELASWVALDKYNTELRADLLEAARLGSSERKIDLPAIRKLAVALEGGFDMPDPIQFVFDAMVEIDRLLEAEREPIEDPWVFVKQTNAISRQKVWSHAKDESRDYIRKTDTDGIYEIRQSQLHKYLTPSMVRQYLT